MQGDVTILELMTETIDKRIQRLENHVDSRFDTQDKKIDTLCKTVTGITEQVTKNTQARLVQEHINDDTKTSLNELKHLISQLASTQVHHTELLERLKLIGQILGVIGTACVGVLIVNVLTKGGL